MTTNYNPDNGTASIIIGEYFLARTRAQRQNQDSLVQLTLYLKSLTFPRLLSFDLKSQESWVVVGTSNLSAAEASIARNSVGRGRDYEDPRKGRGASVLIEPRHVPTIARQFHSTAAIYDTISSRYTHYYRRLKMADKQILYRRSAQKDNCCRTLPTEWRNFRFMHGIYGREKLRIP